MHGLMRFLFIACFFSLAGLATAGQDVEIPLGANYRGEKSRVTVGDFAVQVAGAPREIGDGLREMLQTALFESNYFVVLDRLDPVGISAEQLLSDSFMADADAILLQGQMEVAELTVYGTVVSLEAGGGGLRVKMPWLPLNVGGKFYQAKALVELRVVDTATSEIVAVSSVESVADSGSGVVGTTFTGIDMPAELEMFRNTPLELCIRDTIYRGVIDLCRTIPRSYFRHR